jgi:MscS family membrane protein
MTMRGRLACVLGMLLLAGLPADGGAQTAEAPATSTTTSTATSTTAAGPPVGGDDTADLGFTSPRSTMRGFVEKSRDGRYEDAAKHLDLRRLSKNASGTVLARKLRTVFDRTLWIEFDAFSDSPDGDTSDGLARRDIVGLIRTSKGPVEVAVEKVPEADGTQAWKIASSVVARIPELYAEFGDGPFADMLPEFLLENEVFAVRLWQWIGILVLLAAGAPLAWLATGPVLRVLAFVVPADRRHQSERFLAGLKGPLRLFVVIAVLSAGMPWLALGVAATSVLTIVRKTATTVAITWLWLRIVDVVAKIADDRLRIHGRAGAVGVIPLGRRTVKIFVALMAVIAIVQNLGYDATGILAGLGVGGLALALAAQKTVENLFGGMVLITDQPVRVGDACRFGNRIGVVEDIGLRSTRIRTPERTLISVPNAEFSSKEIENLAVRDRMWLQTTLGVRLDATTAQLRAALDGLRAVLEATPRIDRGTVNVRFVNITATAFEVELQAYVATRDWNEFLVVREDVYLKALDALEQAGTGLTGRPLRPRSAPPPPDESRS